MNKLAVAAAVLALAGVAAAGVYHFSNSSCSGTCPMTGEPLAAHHQKSAASLDHLASSGPAADAAFAAHGATPAGCPMSGGAGECAEEAAASECQMDACEEKPQSDCCKKQKECGDCEPVKPVPAEKP